MKMIKREEPRAIDMLRKEMDHVFDDLVPFSLRKESGGSDLRMWSPSVDISEDESEYLIKMDIPGMDKKDIKVNYQDGRLTVTGERKTETKEEEKDYIRQERYRGSFYRSFTLTDTIKDEEIQATFKDGVLKLVVPKAETVKPKSIKVN